MVVIECFLSSSACSLFFYPLAQKKYLSPIQHYWNIFDDIKLFQMNNWIVVVTSTPKYVYVLLIDQADNQFQNIVLICARMSYIMTKFDKVYTLPTTPTKIGVVYFDMILNLATERETDLLWSVTLGVQRILN